MATSPGRSPQPEHVIDIDEILGKNVTVQARGYPTTTSRYFNGYRLEGSRRVEGSAATTPPTTVRPGPWLLTRTTDCRIFQDMTVPDIVKKVFDDHPAADFDVRFDGHLSQVDLLRAVPRDRLQLRQPADGGGGHLLLHAAHRRPQHGGTTRLDGQALPGRGYETFRSSRRSRSSAGVRARRGSGTSRARFSQASTCTTTTTSRTRASS